MLPLISIPIFEAPPIPPKKLSGIEITSAQGQDTTRNDNALYIQSANASSFINSGGITASNTAIITTIGV